jgi:hypothetical protein
MKKVFLIASLFAIFSCSDDNQELNSNLSSNNNITNEMLQRKTTNTISYEEAKIIAQEYTVKLNNLFDYIEDNNFKSEEEAYQASITYLNNNLSDLNSSIFQKIGINQSFNFSNTLDYSNLNQNDINLLDLTEREKYYLSQLYNYQITKDNSALINLTDSYINEVKNNSDIESLSVYFALIDVNRDVFLSTNVAMKANANCAKAAIIGGTVSGATGMVSGAIKGGIYGTVLGMNPGTGAVGAIAGAIGGGLFGFVSGAVTSYLSCKVYG